MPIINRKLFIVLGAWFALGGLDFVTGFVQFSPLRLFLLGMLALFLLPVSLPASTIVMRVSKQLQNQRLYHYGFLTLLTFLGYALFLSRYLRGANMADDAVFQEVISRTAHGCFFCFPEFGGSYFAGHNNLFLVLFVPLTVLPFWWLIVHLIHSFVIVIWCRIGGWAWGRNTQFGWYVTVALFLATYTQHGAFYDARFAALLLCIFALGYYLQKKRLMLWSALGTLPTRETASLTLFMFGLVGVLKQGHKKMMALIAIAGLVWFVGSYALVLKLGGPIVPRFDSCIKLRPDYLPDISCFANAVTTDWQLKLAYTARLGRFAPTLGALPSLVAALPDIGFTWLSKDNVLYSLSWHYYMQTLGLFIVGAGISLSSSMPANNLPMRWIIASALWQFVTTFRFNLF